MKTTNYHFGNYTFKANFKTVGQGWEVTVNFNKKCVFVGNFIHKAEAMKWWQTMNTEIKHFTKTYWIANNTSAQWYGNFVSNHLYKCYYKFLDKMFTKYNRTYTHAFSRDKKKYQTMRKSFNSHNRFHLVRAA